MPCSDSKRSLAALHLSGSPTITGTICVGVSITGRPTELSTALTRAARSWWRSRSQFDDFRCRIAAAAAAQTIKADRVDLIEIGHRAIALGEIADCVDRRDVTVHGIEALEG